MTDRFPNIQPIMVICHTYGWSQECLESFNKHFPQLKILVYDNNPIKNQRIIHNHYDRQESSNWNAWVDLERKEISQYPFAKLVQPKNKSYDKEVARLLSHGEVLDGVVEDLISDGVDIMLHLEPDCIVFGTDWFHNLLNPIINENVWLTGATRYADNRIHPTPAMYVIDKVQEFGFQVRNKTQEELDDPLHYVIINRDREANWHKIGWDTGMKIWYECARRNKARHVSGEGFYHYWSGSARHHRLRDMLYM